MPSRYSATRCDDATASTALPDGAERERDASVASIDLTIREILTDFRPEGATKCYILGMTPISDILTAMHQLFSWSNVPTSSLALLALGIALVESSKLSKLRKEHEQLRKDFDEFINEILQKKSTVSDEKEL